MNVVRELTRLARELVAGEVKILRSKGSYGVNVEMETADDYVGYIAVNLVKGSRLHTDTCSRNVRALVDSEFGGKEPNIYYISDVDIEKEFRGKGYGKVLYREALKMIAPAIVIPGGCTGMGTTKEAFRVWKSLSREYKTLGTAPKDMAMAVK